MILKGIPLNALPRSVQEVCVLMAHRPQYLFRMYRAISAALVLGTLSAFAYMWMFSVMSHMQPAWTFLLGIISAGLSAFVVNRILTRDEPAFTMRRVSEPKQPWDGFTILVAAVTLPANLLAHAVRFRHLVRTKFPDPKKDARYELFERFFRYVIAWNRFAPSVNQFMHVHQTDGGDPSKMFERVSDQLAALVRHEDALYAIANQLHVDLSVHPIGTIERSLSYDSALEVELLAWGETTKELIPGLFVVQ